ncbi:IS66 family insertion sequence element accessory protein TnpB [Treponema primitia]|uniref:IS66 family transposase zinc-finger binding domain-containing protein n=1 Tax=Treponema primitia TaxID=88058 RepID=UPI003980CFD1
MTLDLSTVKIYIRPGYTDLRKATNGLTALIQKEMKQDPLSGSVYLFCNRARGRKPIDPAIPREVEIIDIPEADKMCACGTILKKIGEEVSERLEIVPPRIYVKQIVRPKHACPECEGVDDPDKPTVRVASAPVSIIPGSIVTPGLLSTIMIAKYQDHLPFYRQELQFERIGVTISRQDMANFSNAA